VAILGILNGCRRSRDLERFAHRHHSDLSSVLGLIFKPAPAGTHLPLPVRQGPPAGVLLLYEKASPTQKPDGYSLRSAYKWLARYRTGGVAALADRRSVRRTQRRTLDPHQLQQAIDLRHQRCTLRRIARALSAPLATVGRLVKGLGLGRLKNLDPKPPVRRYQWEKPGDMIHVDI